MRRQQAAWRWTRIAAAVLSVAVSGCASNHPQSFRNGTVESEDEIAGTAPTRLGGLLGGPKLHGWHKRATPDMQMDLNSMTDADFVAYLGKLEYDTHSQRSQLVDATCQHGNNPNDKCGLTEGATLYIEPEIGAHLRGFPGSGSHGFIVARIISYDPYDRVTEGISFQPHTRYWWVVNYNQQTHQPQSLFVSRTYKALNPLDTVPGTFGFVACNHPKKDYKRAEAKFGTCARFLPSAVAAAGDLMRRPSTRQGGLAEYIHPVSFRATVPPPASLMVAELTGGWISCPTGCCSTQ
jgi:hypothetical protein